MTLKTIAFDVGGNSDGFVKEGFSRPEKLGRWTIDDVSVLEIPDLHRGASGRLRMRFAPYIAPPTRKSQRLAVQIGDRLIYENEFDGAADVTITLPRSAADESGILRLRFLHPDAVSPKSIGQSDDERRLAFVIWDITVDDEEPRALPAVQRPASDTSIARPGTLPKVAAVTMVYNESEYLPIWLSHYGRQVGLENCFVVDHGSDDGSTDFVGPSSRIKIPRSPYEPHKQSSFNSKFCNSLLEWYDWVIYSDVDEIVMADPLVAPNLREYCSLVIPRVVTAIGLNVIHRVDQEPSLDMNRPIARQRPYVFSGASMCKPLLTSQEIAWSPGSHSSDAPMAFDNLYLFHLRWYDFGSCMRRLRKTRSMAWARTDAGRHQRLDDDAMQRQFAAFARMPTIEGVEFSPNSPPINEFLNKVVESHEARKNELYKLDLGIWGQRLWRMPERFMTF